VRFTDGPGRRDPRQHGPAGRLGGLRDHHPGRPQVRRRTGFADPDRTSVNTVNKWAAGITDTLVLGLLVEGYGYGVPTAVVPYTNKVMALHPALHESLAKLRDWGVHVLYGEDVCRLGGPGQTDRFRGQFPWRRALQAVSTPITAASRVEPGAVS
jgi:phosphopantothenoylcysteine decarboxylase